MIDREIGQYYIYTSAIDSGYFTGGGKTPFEAVFYWPFKDLMYLMGLKIISN